MAMRKDPEKSVDVPPTGSRNPDPITDAPGSHPVETGIGAAVGGLASGAAIGSVAGPVGTAVGAAIGAIAGGYAGKGVGELIDPTTEDNWLRESYPSRDYAKGTSYETYEPAYDYARGCDATCTDRPYQEVEAELKSGWDKTEHAATLPWDKARHAMKDVYHYRAANSYAREACERHGTKPFTEVESDLKAGWGKTKHAASLTWDKARDVVRDAYERTIPLREERLKVGKKTVKGGEVDIRKEVVTENKTVTVPVEREEVVIERRPASGHAAAAKIGASGEEIRIPVRKEEVQIGKETVVTEEVNVGKRTVHGTEKASGTVRKEEIKVDEKGDVDVRDKRGR
jgi:uncharacterized protein (TIGR02271 family)